MKLKEDESIDEEELDPKDPDVSVANGSKNMNFRVIENADALYASLLVKVNSLQSTKEAMELKQGVDQLYRSAVAAWENIAENKEAIVAVAKTVPEMINVKSIMALEQGAVYIPLCPVAEGSIAAMAIINSWRTRVYDIQARISSRVNSLSVKAPKITEKEQKTSNSYNNIQFFISNDPGYHGELLLKKCINTKEPLEVQKYVKQLYDILLTFGVDTECVDDFRASDNNFDRWKGVLRRCLTALESRVNEPKTSTTETAR